MTGAWIAARHERIRFRRMKGYGSKRPMDEKIGVDGNPHQDEAGEECQMKPQLPPNVRDVVGDPLSERVALLEVLLHVPGENLRVLDALQDLPIKVGHLAPLFFEHLLYVLMPELVELDDRDIAVRVPIGVLFFYQIEGGLAD